jgi:transcriptional regulator with GAF, ATPase, and Fis domain
VVSAGESRAEPDADWSRIDGDFRRFPIGKRKVGSVAATTEAVCVEDARKDSKWIARPDWAEREGILGFGGQPLVYHGEILGVLGVFTRSRFCGQALGSLRMLADHAAAAIANARAFDENAGLRQQLELENEYLRDEICEAQAFGEIVGVSPAIRQIEEQIEQVAPTDATVLILGESGTGKELVAREIHRCSDRAERPMIRVNCASVPKELYESEFFGHVKGAFTGAIKDRVGRFAAADGGTLFLDEVGEIPLELQSKLLRVLQEGQYERVGDDRTRTADVRIVAATNRNLAGEVKGGRFREDLFYRLNVFPIEVPPLRKRSEDIPLLAEQFLARTTQKLKRRARLTEAGSAELQAYDWPGNVRELQNAIERAVITAKSGKLVFHLPGSERARAPADASASAGEASDILTDEAIRELERRNLLAALERADGKIYGAGGAAELLGLKPTTVASRIQRLGLKHSESR